jgi:hypothetical protein
LILTIAPKPDKAEGIATKVIRHRGGSKNQEGMGDVFSIG